MKKSMALMALTGILTLASCTQNKPAVECAAGQIKDANGVCITKPPVNEQKFGQVEFKNTQDGAVIVKNANGIQVAPKDLMPGNYEATLSKNGFQPQVVPFTITGNNTTTVTFKDLVPVTANQTTGTLIVVKSDAVKVEIKDKDGKVVEVANPSLVSLPQGAYTARFSQDGYVPQTVSFGIAAGQTTVLTAPTLAAGKGDVVSQAYYVKNGERVAIPADATASQFNFSAWLEDRVAERGHGAGIEPAKFAAGRQYVEGVELTERAPYGTQNVAGAYMQFNDGTGWYPVVGAEVRWDLLPSTLGYGNVEDPNFGNAVPYPRIDPATGLYARDGAGNIIYDTYDYTRPGVLAEIVKRGQQWIRFTASDDASTPGPMGSQYIFDNALTAMTWTNSANGNNTPFPDNKASQWPLFNQTGVKANPNVDGFTWTTVMDNRAVTGTPNIGGEATLEGRVSQAQIRVIGYINGMEIDKIFLEKNFVPAAKLNIRKDVIGGENGKVNGSKSFRITITNDSPVAANDVRISDYLRDGDSAAYAIRGVRGFLYTWNVASPLKYNTFTRDDQGLPSPANKASLPTNVFTLTNAKNDDTSVKDDGFLVGRLNGKATDETDIARQVNIPAFSVLTIEFDAQATAKGTYCDVATIQSYWDANLGDLKHLEDASRNRYVADGSSDDACMVLEPEPALNVIKEAGVMVDDKFVSTDDARFQPGGDLFNTIKPYSEVMIRITVKNTGNELIENVALNDVLTKGSAAAYELRGALPDGAVANANDGFDVKVPDLAPGDSKVYTFKARASANGEYCDVATVTGTSVGKTLTEDDDACFTVGSLRFTKVNQVIRDGQLVNAEGRTDIARDEIILTTVTLFNDTNQVLPNVRLYDTLATGRRVDTNRAIYEDRPLFIDPITSKLLDSNKQPFERTDAYDAKTGILGTLTAAKFEIKNPADYGNTRLYTPLPYVPGGTQPGADAYNGRLQQLLNPNSADIKAYMVPVTVIRSDDTIANAGEYVDFDPVANQAMPGYDVLPGQQLTLRFFSRLPDVDKKLKADTYCNTAWWNYGDIGGITGEVNADGKPNQFDLTQKCVSVKTLLSFEQGLKDLNAKIGGWNDDTQGQFKVNDTIRYMYQGYVELDSTEGAKNNVFTFGYGLDGNTYYFNDANPEVTVEIGRVDSKGDWTHTDANGQTVTGPRTFTAQSTFVNGVRTVKLDPNLVIQPGETIRITSFVVAPSGTVAKEYTTTGQWNATGEIDGKTWVDDQPTSTRTTIIP